MAVRVLCTGQPCILQGSIHQQVSSVALCFPAAQRNAAFPTCLPLLLPSYGRLREAFKSLHQNRGGHRAGRSGGAQRTSSSSSGALLALCCASGAGLIGCFGACSHPSFSALTRMQIVVDFLGLSAVSLLCSASGPGTIHYFLSAL